MLIVYEFALGAVSYACLELAFCGETHWTMLLTGGLCVTMICALDRNLRRPLWQTCLMGGAVVTTAELLIGWLVNRTLHWNVWSYSAIPGNLLGQICPMFSAVWVLLSIPAVFLGRAVTARRKRGERRAVR